MHIYSPACANYALLIKSNAGQKKGEVHKSFPLFYVWYFKLTWAVSSVGRASDF